MLLAIGLVLSAIDRTIFENAGIPFHPNLDAWDRKSASLQSESQTAFAADTCHIRELSYAVSRLVPIVVYKKCKERGVEKVKQGTRVPA